MMLQNINALSSMYKLYTSTYLIFVEHLLMSFDTVTKYAAKFLFLCINTWLSISCSSEICHLPLISNLLCCWMHFILDNGNDGIVLITNIIGITPNTYKQATSSSVSAHVDSSPGFKLALLHVL